MWLLRTQKVSPVKQRIKAIICHPTQMVVSNQVPCNLPLQPIIVYTGKHASFLFLPQNTVNYIKHYLQTKNSVLFLIFSPTESSASGDGFQQ